MNRHQKAARARWALAVAMRAAGHTNWAIHHERAAMRHEREWFLDGGFEIAG